VADAHGLARRNGQLGEAEHDAREDVDDNLLVDGRGLGAAVGGAAAEDQVARGEAGDEGVDRRLLARAARRVQQRWGVAQEV